MLCRADDMALVEVAAGGRGGGRWGWVRGLGGSRGLWGVLGLW